MEKMIDENALVDYNDVEEGEIQDVTIQDDKSMVAK